MNFFNKLSLGSKILVSLLLVSMLSILLTGYIGYSGGRQGLTDAVFNQLTGLRNVQAQAIANDFKQSESFLLTLSEAKMVIDATKEFKAAFAKLKDVKVTPQQHQKLLDYYEKEFIPRLEKNVDGQPVAQTYMPFRPAEKYLQYYYTANNPNPVGKKIDLDFAGDGSEYSNIHRKYHSKFRNIIKRIGYYDFNLIDSDTGQVIYNASKEADFTTNLKDGSFVSSGLADAYTKSVDSRDPFYVSQVDFTAYRPSYGLPTSFVTTTVFDGDELIGVLVLQQSNDRINKVMTFDGKWTEAGLGKSGETQLVGEDKLLRTKPRLFLEDKNAYFKALEKANYDPAQIERIRNIDSPILSQKVDTEGVRRALSGDSGITFYKDYRGVPVLGAYQPVKIGDSRWALVAKVDESEAFKAIHDLTNRLIVTTAILLPLFTLFSIFLARYLARPINRLIAGTKRIAAGEKGVQVNVESQDEIGELAQTFNGMSSSLDEKDAVIEGKIGENNRLLLNILPEPVAKRLQSGEQGIADSFPNVTILYAEIVGFNEFAENVSPNQTVAWLNELVGAFDEAAEQFGIEKLKTIGTSYIAVCGLSIPRIDHAKRTVDFGFALLKLIRMFNQKQGSTLGLDIGIHTGPVVAGIVGKSKFIYELYGETMTIAKVIHYSPNVNAIQVSESIYLALKGVYDFQPLDTMAVKGKGTIPVWSVYPLNSLKDVGVEEES